MLNFVAVRHFSSVIYFLGGGSLSLGVSQWCLVYE